jgi:predicted flap endonuclease-1-like 5' DNA nuclease
LRVTGRADAELRRNAMSYSIKNLDGLETDEIKLLKSLGIRTTDRLLEAAASPKGRRQLFEKSGIDEKRLLKFANTCDHLRIKGMGKGYVELLHEAGVDTVRELRYRKPENLAKEMTKANERNKLVRFLPSEKLVVRWIEQAKKLPLMITYKNRAEGARRMGHRKLSDG